MEAGPIRAFFGLLLIGCVAASPGFGEVKSAQQYSVRELMSPGQVAAISLSPSGRHVAVALRVAGGKADVIRVMDVEHPESIRAVSHIDLVADDGGAQVRGLHWVDDARVVAEIGTDLKQRWQRVYFGSGIYMRSIHYAQLHSFDALRGGNGLALDKRLRDDSILPDAMPIPGTLSVIGYEGTDRVLYRLDAYTGALVKIEDGDRVTCCWRVNGGEPAMKLNWKPGKAAVDIFVRSTDAATRWKFSRTYELEEIVALDENSVGYATEPMQSFIRSRRDSADTFGIHLYDWAKGEFIGTVAERRGNDLDSGLVAGGRFLAAGYTDDRFRQDFSDPAMREAYRELERWFGPDNSVAVQQSSRSGHRWLVRVSGPRRPPTYQVVDITNGQLGEVVADFPRLDPESLSPVTTLRYTTDDNVELMAFLTCPAWRGEAALPLIVIPPPDPATRSALRFNPEAQAFAAQGWCVLEPNYRGVHGFGRKFEESAHGQWSARVAQDIVQATWKAVDLGIAKRNSIAFFARRLGAYAALSAAIRNSGLFKACVTRDAAANLELVVNRLRMAYAKTAPIVQQWINARGGEERLSSPVARAAELNCPSLLLHREGVDEITFTNSTSLAEKLEKADKRVRVKLLPDDRTWSQDFENEIVTIEEAIAFLRQYLPYEIPQLVPAQPIPRPLPEPAPPVASLDNCIQPASVDRETCLGRVRLGMTRAEAESVLGVPDGTTRDGLTLRYGDRYLKFDADGRLAKISDRPL